MSGLTVKENRIAAMSEEAVEIVRALETQIAKMPQINIDTDHVFHAGMYARTVTIPAGSVITGTLIKVATILIVNGHVHVFIGGEVREMIGYHVLAAGTHRKQAFVAVTDTQLTMIFKSEAKCTEQAENEFTDEGCILMSRTEGAVNNITVTGE